MPASLAMGLDAVAIGILTFGLYFPRHRRRDLIVSYLGVNIGVLAVAQALASAEVNAGLGLGLFGVLSIIRLRSFELDQQEVAYYFAALALGLIGGVPIVGDWAVPTLMAGVLVAIYLGDHPRLFARYRVETFTLDAAYTNEPQLIDRLEQMLNAHVYRVHVRRVDLVNDTTNVEVRYQLKNLTSTDEGPRPSPKREMTVTTNGNR